MPSRIKVGFRGAPRSAWKEMIEQFVNFVIRPPRAEYNPNQYLWEEEFTIARRKYKRIDLELKNEKGHTLKCSHYVPFAVPENTALPCVIYCHGNSGCRADANEAAVILLPSNITVFTLDFSGSGLSDGEYVSLGWHEKDDLKVVVSYLRSTKQVSCIGLWGRSMGAVTSLLYGAEDPSITGMVLDSSFSNLFKLMLELSVVYKIRLPRFTVRMALQYLRRVILRKANFDIMDLSTIQIAPKTFIPALFGHASEDNFVQPHHSDIIYQAYAGDKNIIKFEGDHNTPRPQFYYDSVSIFFYNVLRPPHIHTSFSSKRHDLGEVKICVSTHENLLYEIINGLRAADSDAACSSSAAISVPRGTAGPNAKSVAELLSESLARVSTDNDLDFVVDGDNKLTEIEENGGEKTHTKDKINTLNEERCSISSSNRESWGRCSSGGEDSDGSSSAGSNENSKSRRQMSLKALATPLRRIKGKSSPPKPKKKKKSNEQITIKEPKMEILENNTLGQRIRCFLGRPTHKRCQSS